MNSKIFSLPPHVSVAWGEVASLEVKAGILCVHLKSGRCHEIPGLSDEKITEVFAAHSASLSDDVPTGKNRVEMNFGMPPMGLDGLEGMSMPMQHNPDQKDAPNMPPEVIDKIIAVSEAPGIHEQAAHMPPAEPHCNCLYCQIARAIHGDTHVGFEPEATDEEEEVLDTDLTFRDWIINPDEANQNLYIVVNPANEDEHYSVFLGKPIGCTCGHDNCEHIRAVLNS